MCDGCRGYRDGYLGAAMLIPKVFSGATDLTDGRAVSYCYANRAGALLRETEWSNGLRTRAMFDIDAPNAEVFVPRIPQVNPEGG